MKHLNLNAFLFIYLIFLLINYCLSASHPKEEWKSRAIYELVTDRFALTRDNDTIKCEDLRVYCGGTFNGIKNHLDYIKGMGFDAIWISPPLKNKPGSYHGYHNIDLNSINENFGTDQELKDLITECHNKDIWVILDAVPNHMADGVDKSTLKPFDKEEYYHGEIEGLDCSEWDNYNQTIVENCDVWGLPDLKQENDFVKKTLIDWLKNTLNNYGFDGVRYADVPNVPKWFWGNFTEAANTYTLGIVGVNSGNEKDVEYVAGYEDYMDAVGNYPLYYTIRESFCTGTRQGSMNTLNSFIQNMQKKFKKPEYMGIWIGNHDKERFLYQCPQNISLRNAIVFTFFFEGIPMFYYGDEQYFNGSGDPNNREMLFGHYNTDTEIYKLLATINNIRKTEKIYEEDFIRRYHDNNHYIFTRGNVLIAVGNGDTTSTDITLRKHGYKNGDKLCNALISDNTDCITVADNELHINLVGEPKIYIKQTRQNSGPAIAVDKDSAKFLEKCLLGLFLSLLFYL
jgi:alpha-amylase